MTLPRRDASSASTAPPQTPPEKEPSKRDVVLLGPPTSDGEGVHVLRARDERIETGELRALREGRPITGEVVSLRPREDAPRLCDVTESYVPPTTAALPAAPRKGPAQVATDAYRDGWEGIFGPRTATSVN